MAQVCILTDNTAQFPVHLFPGSDLVSMIPCHVQLDDMACGSEKDVRLIHLPSRVDLSSGFQFLPPSVEEFTQVFLTLGYKFNEIVVILLSSGLSPALEHAQAASELAKSPASIRLIDSQTTSVGLGMLVQAAASAAQQGWSGSRISRLVRGLIPHIYGAFCLHNLSYLSRAGYIDPAQAIVGEMLNVVPFSTLENGRLTPTQKVRGPRHLVDLFYEFVMEFSEVKHLALVQGTPSFEQETRLLRERLSGFSHASSFSEHTLSVSLGALFGPHSLGMFVMEKGEDDW